MINDILTLAPEEAYKELTKKPAPKVEFETIQKQWDTLKHDVFDEAIRPKKLVKKDSGLKNEDGTPKLATSYQEVNRIGVPFQQIIVNRAVGFLLGNPVKLKDYAKDEKEERLMAMIQKTWDDNKLDYFNRKLARKVLSECEVAELWYLVDDQNYWKYAKSNTFNGKFRIRGKILSQSNGDKLYPHFDEYGDMDAFSREYVITRDGKKVTVLDVWTAEKVMSFEKAEGNLSVAKNEANPFGKIPVIYYQRDYPEWYFVQKMIDRLEVLLSNFGDTNDYFGSPMVAVKGKVLGLAEKGEAGKVLELQEGADAKYLDWDHAPESVKLEIETLIELIYTLTQTPNISFAQMKGLGNLSGIALKLMFMDAHMKVENHIELFGEMFQRRLNLFKTMLGKVVDVSLSEASETLVVEPVFTPYMPRNEREEVEVLNIATGGKPTISQQTGVENNPFAVDIDEEMKRLQEEEDREVTRTQKELTGNFEM